MVDFRVCLSRCIEGAVGPKRREGRPVSEIETEGLLNNQLLPPSAGSRLLDKLHSLTPASSQGLSSSGEHAAR